MSDGSEEYTAKDIQVLEGLEGVRKRPAMYIGDTGKRGLHHLIYEIVDNSIDETLAGYCKNVWVTLHKDGSASIKDDGRGIPTDIHPQTGKSTLETVSLTLHAGGKFEKKAYRVSGGLHGVGMSVVNALSERMEIEVHRNGRIFHQSCAFGKLVTSAKDVGSSNWRGTIIRFKPDGKIFSTIEFEYEYLKERFMELAFLNKEITIIFIDERPETVHEETYHYEGGLVQFVEHLNQARTKIQTPFYYIKRFNSTDVEYALQYSESYNDMVYTFVNDIKTIEGGTHLAGFKTAITRALNEYGRSHKILKNEEMKFSGDDVLEGLTAVVSIKIPEPQFEGQTKTKLGNSEVKGVVDSVVYESFMTHLEENPEPARKILAKVMNTMEAREAAQKAKDLIRRKNIFETSILPGKLADCEEEDPTKSELYFVEGESAGGSSKQARDRRNQAILPLKGKILNVEKAPLHRTLVSEEIRAIILSLGCGIKEDFDINKLRYHKCIIMSVDYNESTVVKDPKGKIRIVKIGEFIDKNLGNSKISGHQVLCFDMRTHKTTFKPIKKVIKHKISEQLYKIGTSYGRSIKVTSSHSLFTYKNGEIVLKKTSELKEGDYVLAPCEIPLSNELKAEIDLLEELYSVTDTTKLFIHHPSVVQVYKNRVIREYQNNPEFVEERVEIPKDFGCEMVNLRIENHFSQKQVCDFVGIKQPITFYNWEKGVYRPTVSNFKKYMELLGVDFSEAVDKAMLCPIKLEHIWKTQYNNSKRNRVKEYIQLKDLNEDELKQLAKDIKLSPTHYGHNAVNRFISINEDLLFTLGFFLAEGSCNQRNGVRFAIGPNNHKAAEIIKNALENLFGVKVKNYTVTKRVAELRIQNSVVSLLFGHLFGFNDVDSTTKRIPNIVFNSSRQLQLAFLKGYLAGDGTVSENGIHFSTSSKELANDLLYLFLSQGVIASISEHKPNGNPSIKKDGNVIITKSDFYHISVVAKEDLLKLRFIWQTHHLSHKLMKKINSEFKYGQGREFVRVSGDLVAFRIKSMNIVEPSKEDVYDFSVEDDENFIAGFGGLCAHNTDADVDGSHIRTLILTLFYRYFKQIIEAGYIYIAQPPLYKIWKGKTIRYAYNDAEKDAIVKELGEPVNIQRYKGLGEMNPDQLWETTMDPERRTLKRVTIEDAMKADELFTILMGDEVEPRRKFIEAYAKDVKNLDV